MTKWVVGGSLVVSLAVVGSGYVFWQRTIEASPESLGVPRAQTLTTSASCDGTLIDSHSHWDEGGYPERYRELMDQYDIGCAVVFANAHTTPNADDASDKEDSGGFFDFLMPVEDDGSSSGSLDDIATGRFIRFFHVNPARSSEIAVDDLKTVLAQRPGFYVGFGEVGLYQPGFRSDRLTDAPWPEVFAYLGGQDLWLMLHLFDDAQLASLETMLARYPKTRVLLHGEVGRDRLSELLATYPNLYLTVDTSMLLVQERATGKETLLYPAGQSSADRFVRTYDAAEAAMLDRALAVWAPIIRSAPEKVLWGTDVAMAWHLDAAVYGRIVRFSRAFIEALPEEIQAPYAHENARRLFLSP